ncbi:hypothetical protein Rleg10DRAFT_7164 [Rhizobium leguminosarum bv. trifolii WSM2012]|nr:hypothetical protein Rleg10DRAFT_7164 [Rhizobium leguminosarum bv. trifolii WSM2012]
MEKHNAAKYQTSLGQRRLQTFLKEVEGYLAGYMQIGTNAEYTRLAADYYAKGRTPGYCAYALARHAGVWRPF